MNFSLALDALKSGHSMTREAWNGEYYINLRRDPFLPVLVFWKRSFSSATALNLWNPLHPDLTADDWEECSGEDAHCA